MLDAATPLQVPGAEVLAWADLDGTDVVWALPARPRLTVAADGLPQAELLLYRRGKDSPPAGGQLNLTVDLELTGDEREAAARAGAARRPPRAPGEPEPPPVEVRAPQWLEGAVRAELLPELRLDGRPSLLGANTTVLIAQLDAAQAAAVRDAWEAGFPEATIELDGAIEGATAASASASASSTTTGEANQAGPAQAGRFAAEAITVAAAARTPARIPVQLRGPLRLPSSARTARRTDLNL